MRCPPPSSDRTGDNVRIVEWDAPLAIPGLSRASRILLERSRQRQVPPAALRRAYAERRARIIALAQSPAFLEMLGLAPGADSLEALSGEPAWSVVALAQRHRGVPVRGARVALNIAGDNVSIASVVSTLQPDLAPPEAQATPDEAVSVAIEAAPGISSVPLVALEVPPPLQVVREPSVLGGARRATEVRRANDQLVYAVRLVTDDAVARHMAEVWVDAATGLPTRTISFSSGTPGGLLDWLFAVKPVPKAITVGQAVFEDLMFPLLLCANFEGQGSDADSVVRRFSTTYYPKETNPFAMVSCNEWGMPERLLKAQDVVTFRDSPLVDPKFDQADVFRDDNDLWIGTGKSDDLLPHAVSTHYWGERVLRYFKKNGYTTRHDSDQPVRFVAWQKGISEAARFWKLTTSLGSENGEIDVGVGGPHFTTSADPMVLAHELGHSLWLDVLNEPPDKSEKKAIYEGLSDCFAMAAMNDMQQDWTNDPVNNPPHPGYDDLHSFAPFSFWAGSYKDASKAEYAPGYPNLWNPKKSWPLDWPTPGFRFTHWAGRRSLDSDYEKDSTLVGGVCRLMVTGGPTVAVDKDIAVTGGGQLGDSLGSVSGVVVDRQAGFQRLTRLLMYTLLEAKNEPTSFHDFVDILAANRKTLSTSAGWFETNSEERMRRTFAEYGFGRGVEHEPNDYALVAQIGPGAAANLIAAGANYSRPITGNLCSKDQDFFVVNEKAGVGDKVEYGISVQGTSKDPAPEFDIRFYRYKPCSFEETPPKNCALDNQVFPAMAFDGTTPQVAPANDSFAFTPPPGGGCTNGPECAGKYYPLFVGVRLKSGPCNAAYKIDLKLKRSPGNQGVQ
ncbi:MAG: hypothetical protein HYZ29_36840 [Myxococcales bacterium]|nr:hypothetical protein [Myxococcales bacterium]